jgi:hypothetical protein
MAFNLLGQFGAGGIKADTIAEATSGAGVTADGVLLKDGAVTTSGNATVGGSVTATGVSSDTISEKTGAAGVTIDGVLCKDGRVYGTIALNSLTATTSGTSVEMPSVPAGTKRIVLTLSGVSTSGSSNPLLQLGDSGGYETTGYLGSASFVASGSSGATAYTTGFGILSANAVNVLHGSVILTLMDAATNLWAASGAIALSNTAQVVTVAGSKALSATLDRLRLTTVAGTDTYDAGTVNYSYEA